MLLTILCASAAVLVVSLPGHLLLDRLWAAAFGPALDAVFRSRRHAAMLRTMWLDFINMCFTDFLALLAGLSILGPESLPRFGWLMVAVVALTSLAVIAIISTRTRAEPQSYRERPPATPMMTAGAVVAILLGLLLMK